MSKHYLIFFQRASEFYGKAGGYNNLVEAINSGKLKDGLNEKEYATAKEVLLNFFDNNRIFGLNDFEISKLVSKCMELSNIPR